MFVSHRVQIPNSLSSDEDLETSVDNSKMLVDNSEGPDDNLKTLDLVVIDLPEGSEKAFTTHVPKVLVVLIYETFWDILKYEDQLWQQSPIFPNPSHAMIVTGQPGIGQCAIAQNSILILTYWI